MSSPVLASAQKYVAEGLSVIPVNGANHPDESKRKKSTLPWKPFQSRIATEEELQKLFRNGENIAAICGAVSGNLEVLDFDAPKLFRPFLDSLNGHDEALSKKLMTAKTPSGGYHLLYRCSESVSGSLKLAMSSDGRKVLVETRGESAYILISPSQGYQLLGDISNLQTITKDERDLLIWLATTFDERPEQEPRHARNQQSAGNLPSTIFNSKADFRRLLEEDGWSFCLRVVGDREHLTRPGKKAGTTSATLHPTKGLYVFSSSTDLPTEKPLDPFGYIAHARFNGDFTEAARWVRDEYPNEFDNVSERSNCGDNGDSGDNRYTGRQGDDSCGDTDSSEGHDSPRSQRNYSSDIRSFLGNLQGSFKNSDIDSEFNYRTRNEKQGRSKILSRLEKEGKIKKIHGTPGHWRTVNTDLKPMKRTGKGVKPFSIPFPLGIGELANIYPGNIIMQAGETGAGKTGFSLKTVANLLATSLKKHVHINKEVATSDSDHLQWLLKNGIHYFNSEMGEAEITAWEDSLGVNLLDNPILSIYEDVRYGWEDLIQPNGINIIDYVEIYENFYAVGQILSDIEAALDKGIAIICIQKAAGREYGLGGQFSAWKARLVITLSLSRAKVRVAKLQKVKAPKDRRKNPEGQEIDYLVTPAGDFHPLTLFRYVDDRQRARLNQEYQNNPPMMPFDKNIGQKG